MKSAQSILASNRRIGTRTALLVTAACFSLALPPVAANAQSPQGPGVGTRSTASVEAPESKNSDAVERVPTLLVQEFTARNSSGKSLPEKTPTAEELAFFEKKIRPVLAGKCYKCHSTEAEKLKGGLLLDTREGIRNGGDSGHTVIPGDPKQSLLLKALHWEDPDLQMPPKEKLSADTIADFEQWVKMGAPDPRDGKAPVAKKGVDLEKAREHWAFQLPRKSAPPAVRDSSWPRSDIDRFVLERLEVKKLKPVNDADKSTLIRRIYFDLIGLPPSPEDVEAFLKNNDPKALETIVDQLLGSPQFGEKWGRHWLDVARYAESSGKENNIAYPHAWRYRDWVIKSFNEDKPYDRFLKDQLAGDRLPAKDDAQKADQLIATGFLAIGPKSHNTRNRRQFQLDVADEQIDAVTQGMMGLTVACARCHDHKFDPIPQTDYYAMAGIFLSTETYFGTPQIIQNINATPLLKLPENVDLPDAPPLPQFQLVAMRRQLDQAIKDRDAVLAEARQSTNRAAMMGNQRLQRARNQISTLGQQLERYDESGKPKKFAMGVNDRLFPRDTVVLQRGELDKPLDTVPRGMVRALLPAGEAQPKINESSGRLELAEWIASPENPLTARVMANRVWLHLFGRGLVPTPDNFGTTGQKPTSQPLLDHLAISFVENGWSVKKLVKQIVMSRTYQLGSEFNATNFAADPDNVLNWRMNKRRLDAEEIRDAMLAVAGRLDLTPPKGSPVSNVEGPVLQLLRPAPGLGGGPLGGMRSGGGGNALNSDRPIRSVYLPIVRDQLPDALAVFDFAESSLVIGEREVTTVPSQALYLMNNATVQKLAEGMADRLLSKNLHGIDLSQAAFQLTFSRLPNDRELKAAQEFFARFNDADGERYSTNGILSRASVTAFCQALIASAEFRYLN